MLSLQELVEAPSYLERNSVTGVLCFDFGNYGSILNFLVIGFVDFHRYLDNCNIRMNYLLLTDCCSSSVQAQLLNLEDPVIQKA